MTTDRRYDGPGADALFASGLEEGIIRLPECRKCGRAHLPPRLVCPYCGGTQLQQIEASGKGAIYSVTVIERPPEKGGSHNVVLVDLEEGPRIMSRVDSHPPQQIYIGMAVQAAIVRENDSAVLVFRPIEGIAE